MLNELMDFINKSKTSYNAVSNIKEILDKNGFIELHEEDDFKIEYNKKYYITRNSSSIIAFNIPSDINRSLNIIASHTDSPCFKLKPNFSVDVKGYNTVATEPYGGMIYSTWFDRPLGVAGRVMVKNGDMVEERIIDFNQNVAVLPNLCIHFNRDINNGYKYNATEIKPLISNNSDLYSLFKDKYNINKEDIISSDLYFVNNESSSLAGINNEFLLAPRIDNLLSSYVSLKAFLDSFDTFKFYISFDNEEVGSNTYQGAASNFLLSILNRIKESLKVSEDTLYKLMSRSLIISADNAHAVHPVYSNISDSLNGPILNNGLVIKYNANQSYTTSSVSSAIFKMICAKADAKYQEFSNRSDIKGGSTLGNILDSSVSINTIDIGLPQLAMHSAYETCGVKDIDDYYKAMKEFYNSNIIKDKNKFYIK